VFFTQAKLRAVKQNKASPHALKSLWPCLRVHCPLWPVRPHAVFISYLEGQVEPSNRSRRFSLPHFCISMFPCFLIPFFISSFLTTVFLLLRLFYSILSCNVSYSLVLSSSLFSFFFNHLPSLFLLRFFPVLVRSFHFIFFCLCPHFPSSFL
jgi:hypothetical protein